MSDMQIFGSFPVKSALAQMLKGGVIMDVVTADQAKIAQRAGACAVMALERVPSDIRAAGGVARMTNPRLIKEIMAAVTIPVMAKVRIGHFAEAQILEALKVDFADESEVLTPADQVHIEKTTFKIPFVCGATSLGQALRRIQEGAAMIRTKGEAGTGNVVEAVRHIRTINQQIQELQKMDEKKLAVYAKDAGVSLALVKQTKQLGRLPVVNFAAGGIATPADVALVMQLGVDGVFVGSGIFKSSNPLKMAQAVVEAVVHYKNAAYVAQISEDLGSPMLGSEIKDLSVKMAERGK